MDARKADDARPLDGQVAVVTGGGRGIGAAIARKLADMGASTVICGRSRPPLDVTANRIRNAGGRCEALQCDVSDWKSVQEFAAQVNMAPADMVRETPYIKPGDDVPSVGVNQQFEQGVEALNNANDVGQPIGIKNGFAIPILVDKKDPRIPEFDEVKSKIADSMKQQRAKDQLEQKAKDLLASVSSPDAIKAAGEKEGYDAGVDEGFKLSSTLGKAGSSTALDDLIYGLKQGEISKAPIKVNDNWVIVGIVKRTEPDFSSFNSGERDRLKQQLVGQRETQVFEDYIAGVQQRMKQAGKITIYDKVLNQLDESETSAEPTLPPGLNFPTK